jgi:hypothetical protein
MTIENKPSPYPIDMDTKTVSEGIMRALWPDPFGIPIVRP